MYSCFSRKPKEVTNGHRGRMRKDRDPRSDTVLIIAAPVEALMKKWRTKTSRGEKCVILIDWIFLLMHCFLNDVL